MHNAHQNRKFSYEQQAKAEKCELDINFDMVSQFYVRPEGINDETNEAFESNFVDFLKGLHFHDQSVQDSPDRENVQNLFDYLLEQNPETFNDVHSRSSGHSYQEDAILAGVKQGEANYIKTAYGHIIPYKIKDPTEVIKASSLFAKLKNAAKFNFVKAAFEKVSEKFTEYKDTSSVERILELYNVVKSEHQEQAKEAINAIFAQFVNNVSVDPSQESFDMALGIFNSVGPEFQDNLKGVLLEKLSDIRKSVSKMNKRHNIEGNSEDNIPVKKLDVIRKSIESDSYDGQTLQDILAPQESHNEEMTLVDEGAAGAAALHDSLEA